MQMHLVKKRDFDQVDKDVTGGSSQPPPGHRHDLCSDPFGLHAADFVCVPAQRLPVAPQVAASSVRAAASRPARPPAISGVGAAPSASRFSLLTPLAPLELSFPPVTEGEAAERARLSGIVEACIRGAWEPSTRSRYESALKVVVGSSEVALGMELLPLDNDQKLMALFARMDGSPWATIGVNKAAVRAWHVERGLVSVFDGAWSELALRFWTGLKKRADHTRTGTKRPANVEELLSFQRARLAVGTLAGLRDAAAAGVAFYGIRRSSEVWQLARLDVNLDAERSISLLIRRQKNDPCGRGMACWLPVLAHLRDLCPCALLRKWCRQRDAVWTPAAGEPLFCVTGSHTARQVSYDSWRKAVRSHILGNDVGTHSFRKGGAHWWKCICGLSDEVVQAQGGWASADTMRAFYAKFSDAERQRLILDCAARSASAHAA